MTRPLRFLAVGLCLELLAAVVVVSIVLAPVVRDRGLVRLLPPARATAPVPAASGAPAPIALGTSSSEYGWRYLGSAADGPFQVFYRDLETPIEYMDHPSDVVVQVQDWQFRPVDGAHVTGTLTGGPHPIDFVASPYDASQYLVEGVRFERSGVYAMTFKITAGGMTGTASVTFEMVNSDLP